MKTSFFAMILLSTTLSTVASATDKTTEPVKTLNTCLPNDETNIASLKIQVTSEGYGVVLKHKNGEEFQQEGGCASLSSASGGLRLDCSIVLPLRTTGYFIRVHSPSNRPRFAYVTYRTEEGRFPRPLMICDQELSK